jgi:hypothetical protein
MKSAIPGEGERTPGNGIDRCLFGRSLGLFLGPASQENSPLEKGGLSAHKSIGVEPNGTGSTISRMTCHHPSAGFADPDNRADPVNSPVSDGSDITKFGG